MNVRHLSVVMLFAVTTTAASQGPKLPKGHALEERPADGKAKIVFIAGSNFFKKGEHDYIAACAVLADMVKQSGAAPVLALDWPKDPKTLEGAKAVVIFFDGADKHGFLKGDRLADIQKLADAGTGLVLLHQGVDVPKDFGDRFRELAGGAFETGYSQRAHWVDEFKQFPTHPITRGVSPFKTDDGYLYKLRFVPNLKGITPLLRTANPKGKAAAENDMIVAWTYDRPKRTHLRLHRRASARESRRGRVSSIVDQRGVMERGHRNPRGRGAGGAHRSGRVSDLRPGEDQAVIKNQTTPTWLHFRLH